MRLLSQDYIVLEEFCPEPVFIEQWSDAQWREVSSSPGGRGALQQCCDTCVASLTWPKVLTCQWTFSALQPPLLYREGGSGLAIDDAEEAVVS